MRTRIALLLLLALSTACVHRPDYPVTEQAKSFSELNARLKGSAPAVGGAVTSERIASARAEPQNWLTYYGAYDGQRYSALDQINTGNVARLRPAWIFHADVIGLIATPAILGSRPLPSWWTG